MDTTVMLTLGMVGVVIVYAVLSVYWTSRDPGWYSSLPRPSWQPPDIVFGIIWPLNFVALGIASAVIGLTQPISVGSTFAGVLTVSVAFSLGWAYLFYVPHRLAAAAGSLTVAGVLTWALVVLAAGVHWWLGVLLIPYAVWLTIATTLAYGYAYRASSHQRG